MSKDKDKPSDRIKVEKSAICIHFVYVFYVSNTKHNLPFAPGLLLKADGKLLPLDSQGRLSRNTIKVVVGIW